MAVVVLLVAVVILVAALAVVVRRARDADRDAARSRAEARAHRDCVDEDLRRMRGEVGRTRELLEKLQRSWRAEREWNRELRGQLARMAERRTGFGHSDDVRDLVLQAAIELAEADRGMLLSREDADADGDLDVVLAHGFEHDPSHSAVAQRFARDVLERDQIVREDAPGDGDGERTPADEEIESLVAIPLYLRDRFHGVVICANRPGGFDDVDDGVLIALGDHAGAALHQGMLRHQLQDAHRAAIRTLVEAVAAGDPLLHRESTQLVIHALHLARELTLDDRERDVLVCAVLLRALGYLALPERVLTKPAPLTPEERSLIELHPRIAFNVIGQAPALREVATAVLHHHERYDGTGYPAGLAGEQIPRVSRALAVLEAYGAMTHERVHRASRSPEEACQTLIECAGTQFDAEIVHLFVEEVRRSSGEPSDALAESVLEALPFDPAAGPDAILGPLGGPSTDGLTLLGDHRALQESVRTARADEPLAIATIQLEELPKVNDEGSFLVGDRLIQLAARNATRAAGRLGGTAYRPSGRRLAVVVPLRDGVPLSHVEDQVWAEFAGGPAIRLAVVRRERGERPEDLIGRARGALG